MGIRASTTTALVYLAWTRIAAPSAAAAFQLQQQLASRSANTHLLFRRQLQQQQRRPAFTTTVRRMASTTSTTEEGAIDIAANVEWVRENIKKAIAEKEEEDSSSTTTPTPQVRLVAVSKTKPIELLKQAYEQANVRAFGENYIQEMVDKVPQLPSDVTWHFIGNVQSNKVKLLLSPFLASASSGTESCLDRLVLETVSSLKLARKLQNAIETSGSGSNDNKKLRIFVQVNTSGEDSKSGVSSSVDGDINARDEVVELCKAIVQECPALQLQGLMTIGAPGDESCLDRLVICRNQVAAALSSSSSSDEQYQPPLLELSMGMSGDYEVAIRKGSTNVRVGSTIFGARDYSSVNKK
eukprot:CAMPEP_0198149120 /NCGR_PEP_ID=MMETSP1443-20131203/45140_1 /TAXON_ID=186043 /ORGANISM="Entomoneis sp., Strain CCMP2396" /LENGTH=353 /DNA_ID=CAMNT_0043814049 /DNA_START=69 /DNA_END=1130 /DNA_ORIENTATION=-